jgi:hypothetical protein
LLAQTIPCSWEWVGRKQCLPLGVGQHIGPCSGLQLAESSWHALLYLQVLLPCTAFPFLTSAISQIIFSGRLVFSLKSMPFIGKYIGTSLYRTCVYAHTMNVSGSLIKLQHENKAVEFYPKLEAWSLWGIQKDERGTAFLVLEWITVR